MIEQLEGMQVDMWPSNGVLARAELHADQKALKLNRQVVIGFVAIIALLTISGAAGIVRLAFPALATGVALFLFQRSKPAYLSFTLWVWFLSAFLRRVVDFKAGYQESSLILLAPYLVTMIAGLPFLSRPRSLLAARCRPILLALLAILYGFCVGLLKFSAVQMAPAMLNWLAPLCLAFFFVEFREEYEAIRTSLETTCIYAAIVMGLYTIYQFLILPGWDAYWLENAHNNSFGFPQPLQVRCFGTMGSPVAFGLTLSSVLLIVIGSSRRLRLLALPLCLAALILTINRAAWICFLIGLILLIFRLKNRERTQIILAFAAMIVATACLFQVPGAGEVLSDKINTFSSPGDDVSYQARVVGYQDAIATLLSEPFGEGVGSPEIMHQTKEDDYTIGPHDSIVLELLYSLGWFGTLCYGAGICLVVVQLLTKSISADRLEICVQCALGGLLIQSPLNDIVYGSMGIFFWLAVGLHLAQREQSLLHDEARRSFPTLSLQEVASAA